MNKSIQTQTQTQTHAVTLLPQQEEEDVIYIDSFFIPHVFDYIPLNDLVYIIENTVVYKGNIPMTIGKVDKVESIPKINQKDGHHYYSCFVFMKEWSNNYYSNDIQDRLYNNIQNRIYYRSFENSKPEYILLLPNKSVTTERENPQHIDLVLYLHTDFKLETIQSVMEGLDFGNIKKIEMITEPISENTAIYNTTNIWKYANMDMWDKKVAFQYNTVYVRFNYWYKTNTAFEFQKELKEKSFVDVPVFDGTVWTFYGTDALYECINPYVWSRDC